MATGGFKADRRGIEQLRKHLTKELNRGGPLPIQVAAEPTRPVRRLPGGVTRSAFSEPGATHYHGPVINVVDSAGTQVAVDSSNVVQTQGVSQAVPAEFDALATLLRELVEQLDEHPLTDDDAADIKVSAAEVLSEVVKDTPDQGRIRRGVAAIRGTLTTLMLAGAGEAVSDASQQWAAAAIEGLAGVVG